MDPAPSPDVLRRRRPPPPSHIQRRRASLEEWEAQLYEQTCQLQHAREEHEVNAAALRSSVAAQNSAAKSFDDYTAHVQAQRDSEPRLHESREHIRKTTPRTKDQGSQTMPSPRSVEKQYTAQQVQAMLHEHDRQMRKDILEEVRELVNQSQLQMRNLYREYCDRLDSASLQSHRSARGAFLSDELASVSDFSPGKSSNSGGMPLAGHSLGVEREQA